MDKRIGTYAGDGKRVLPQETISGKAVATPVKTTVALGHNKFAVLDDFPKGDVNATIAELRALVAAEHQPAAPVEAETVEAVAEPVEVAEQPAAAPVGKRVIRNG